MKLEDALVKAKGVFCGCDEEEHRTWYRLITEECPSVEDGLVVEIGCARGGGTTTMAAAAEERGFMVVAIDTWRTDVGRDREYNRFATESVGYPHLVQHIDQIRKAGLRDRVIHIARDCLVVRRFVFGRNPSPVVFLWIDGWHGYPDPKEEFIAWNDTVVIGGIVGFHDCWREGLPRCFKELRNEGHLDNWEEIGGMPPIVQKPMSELRTSMACGFQSRFWRRIR